VLEILDWLDATGVTAWVDGGWGVDALIGHQRRTHVDLDLVVDAKAIERVAAVLARNGFTVVRDWLPTAVAYAHADGRQVDLHPVELTVDGGGDQIQLDGVRRWHYGAPVAGTIADRAVACCNLETQLASHLGYEPDDNDRADMDALAKHFHVVPRPPYAT
jgi:lincosamide nucleotidyltransferase A/C/D/E